jgi:hypothetical protein
MHKNHPFRQLQKVRKSLECRILHNLSKSYGVGGELGNPQTRLLFWLAMSGILIVYKISLLLLKVLKAWYWMLNQKDIIKCQTASIDHYSKVISDGFLGEYFSN